MCLETLDIIWLAVFEIVKNISLELFELIAFKPQGTLFLITVHARTNYWVI
jgi:hypothetical protein